MRFSNFRLIRLFVLGALIIEFIYGCKNKEEKLSSQTPTDIQNQPVVESVISDETKTLEDSLAHTPKNAVILNELSFRYASINDRRSLQLADRMIALPHAEKFSALGHFNKGIYYSNAGKTDSALYEFGAAISEDYQLTDAYIEKAILLYDQKQFKASFNLLEKGTVINKYNPSLYFWMAKNKQEMGKKEESVYFYQQCLELKPSEDEATEATEMIKKQKE